MEDSIVSQKTLRIQLVHSHLLPPRIFFTAQHLPSSHSHYSGYVAVSPHQRPVRHSVVCEVAMKKPDSAVKRDRKAKRRRIYNKSQKSEIKNPDEEGICTGMMSAETLKKYMCKEIYMIQKIANKLESMNDLAAEPMEPDTLADIAN
ncbi:hypothetical protein C1H46_036593 [Malus baccata]|uniref:Uncharacterized protein n=1 Tax=Malus baccata TaxID=106549 RepID=A0A540KUH5_MALBA|nr:hypothetical protein C1H46_036593 [Malus baccata]